MKPSFLSQFQQMVAELREHPHIKVIELDFPSPAKPDKIEEAKRLIGGSIPEAIEAFYMEMDGFRLQWSYIDEGKGQENENDRGTVDILSIQEVLKNWQGVTWFEFEGGDRFKTVKPLDFFAPEACAALVYIEEKGIQPTIYYHYLGEFLCDTGYSFAEFIERLLGAKGYWYWIETLCPNTQGSPQAINFFERMPLLFPNFKPSLFQPREKEVRSRIL